MSNFDHELAARTLIGSIPTVTKAEINQHSPKLSFLLVVCLPDLAYRLDVLRAKKGA